MSIVFYCPTCGQQLTLSDAAAGRQGKCPHCKGDITVPSASSSAAPSPPSAPESSAPFPFDPFQAPPPAAAAPPASAPAPYFEAVPQTHRYEDEPSPLRLRPHRGNMLLIMSIGSIVVSIASFLVLSCPGIGVLASLLGVGLGVAAIIMSGLDWSKMNSAEMDPNGLGITVTSLILGVIGLLLGGTSLIFSAFWTFALLSAPRLPTFPTNNLGPIPTATKPEPDPDR
jgi:hypothetical protein